MLPPPWSPRRAKELPRRAARARAWKALQCAPLTARERLPPFLRSEAEWHEHQPSRKELGNPRQDRTGIRLLLAQPWSLASQSLPESMPHPASTDQLYLGDTGRAFSSQSLSDLDCQNRRITGQQAHHRDRKTEAESARPPLVHRLKHLINIISPCFQSSPGPKTPLSPTLPS